MSGGQGANARQVRVSIDPFGRAEVTLSSAAADLPPGDYDAWLDVRSASEQPQDGTPPGPFRAEGAPDFLGLWPVVAAWAFAKVGAEKVAAARRVEAFLGGMLRGYAAEAVRAATRGEAPAPAAADGSWRVDAVEAALIDDCDEPSGYERALARKIVKRIDGWEAEGRGAEAVIAERQAGAEARDAWRSDEPPKDGTVFHAFHPSLVDEDFNPEGVVEAFWQDDEGFIGAVWNGYNADCWVRSVIEVEQWRPIVGPRAALAQQAAGQTEGGEHAE